MSVPYSWQICTGDVDTDDWSNSQVISAPVIVHTRLGHDKWVLQTLCYDQIHKWSLRPWLCKPDSSWEMRAVDAITRYQFPAANSHLISKPEIMYTRLAHEKLEMKIGATTRPHSRKTNSQLISTRPRLSTPDSLMRNVDNHSSQGQITAAEWSVPGKFVRLFSKDIFRC